MSALAKDLAGQLPPSAIRLQSRVVQLSFSDGHWEAGLEGGSGAEKPTGLKLILALPTPQTLVLLRDSGLLEALDLSVRAQLEMVEYAPTLAVLLRGPAAKPAWKGIQLRDETLSWIGDDSDKRGTMEEHDRTFVLHASSEFSRAWQDRDLTVAMMQIVERAGEIVGDWITELSQQLIHRWRFANVPNGVPEAGFLRHSHMSTYCGPLYVCGDAFFESKIEGAYRSGLATANDVLRPPNGR